jgi:hypothetical protein
MQNTAQKLSSKEILENIKEAHGSLDLLKVFLITGATDISKSYELIRAWHKNAMNDTDKANFSSAMKSLQAIELKRVELTTLIYGIDDGNTIIDVPHEEETHEEVAKVILMLPRLDDTLDKIRKAIKESQNIEKTKQEAFEELKTTVGQGKVMSTEGVPVTWDNDHINQFIDTVVENNKPAEPKTESAFGFKTVYDHITEMVKNGIKEDAIKQSLKTLLVDKVISTSPTDTFLIKGEKGFEDYYSRILSALITSGIKDYEAKNNTVNKGEAVEKEIAETVIPALKEMDKDEKQSSFVTITKMIRSIYQKFGFNRDLSTSLLKAQELAETTAPNLLKRNKEGKKGNISTIELPPKQTVEPPVEIYDDSHNIKESNKELYAEVEKYQYLQEIFDKAVELVKKNNWRDALSMCIILISSGKIKSTVGEPDKETFIQWDTDQIKSWYYTVVEASVKTSTPETVDTVATEVKETPTPEIKTGPAVVAGTIDTREIVTRLLKDDAPYKDKYGFKTFTIKNDRGRIGNLIIQIVDATPEQEPELLVTEANLTKFLDEMRDHLVVKRNEQPWVKSTIFTKLSKFYDVTGSECKGITGALVNEADAIRRANKALRKAEESKATDATEETPVETKQESEVVASPPVERVPIIDAETDLKEETVTETTSTEDTVNSNDDLYVGYDDILKAKTKYDLHKAIYAKASENEKHEDGIKAIFEVINVARKDNRYKKSQIRNWKPTPPAELLSSITKIVEKGIELANTKVAG